MAVWREAQKIAIYIADQVGIVSQHIWSTVKDPVNFQNSHPVATGAYTGRLSF